MSYVIKEKIDKLNEEIQELTEGEKDRFIINKEVFERIEKIDSLQKECLHEYVDGICKYCGTVKR